MDFSKPTQVVPNPQCAEGDSSSPPEPRAACFAALDFETADRGRDSACALSIVRVDESGVVATWTSLIRPPRREFEFTYLHGISWNQVRTKPTFAELWPEISDFLAGAPFLAAHNAPFDRGVLETCCALAGAKPPAQPYVCTVKVARSVWGLYPTNLARVCSHLQIPLKHHDATSDAQACAKILLAAHGLGHDYSSLLHRHRLRR